MKVLKIAALVFAVAAAPMSLAIPGVAQVTTVDVQMAESAIVLAGSRAGRVAAIDHVPSVGVIRLDVHTGARFRDESIPDVSELRLLAGKYQGGIAKLRAALRNNPVTRTALASRGISISRVVGAQISSNGSLRLYLL